jgi:hypothetical protein
MSIPTDVLPKYAGLQSTGSTERVQPAPARLLNLSRVQARRTTGIIDPQHCTLKSKRAAESVAR